MSTRARVVVSTALVTGFQPLLLVVVAVPLALTVMAWVRGWTSAPPLTTLTVVLAAGVGALLVRVRRAGPARTGVGAAHRAPALVALVRRTAAAVGARPPDEVRLVPTTGVWLAEDAFLVGLRRGFRTLYVGVASLQGLSTAQFTAVLAHELAHLDERSEGAIAHRGLLAFASTAATLGPGSVLGRLFEGGVTAVRWAFDPVKRERELAADRAAIAVAGARATVSALREVGPLQAAWDHYLGSYVGGRLVTGRAPSDIVASFPFFLRGGGPEVAAARAGRVDELRPAWDLHPELADRLAPIGGTSVVDGPSAIELVADLDGVVAALEPGVLDRGSRPQVPFTEFMAHATKVAYRRRADELFRAAATLAGVRVGRMATVLDLAEIGQFGALAAALPGTKPAGADAFEPLRAAVHTALVLSFVDAGVVRLAHSWDGTVGLAGPDEIGVGIDEVLELTFGLPDDVVTARKRLAELGVDLLHVWSTTGTYPTVSPAADPA